jgi:hypothetical protein
MVQLCPQLKQNLANINSLKLELDLELSKIEKLFKDLKTDNRKGKEHKAERKDLMDRIKSLKSKINLEINKIEDELPTKKIEVGKEFNLRFKYRNLKEMIEAGKFDWKNGSINPTNFPDPQEKELLGKEINLKAKIFAFEKTISSEDVFKELDKEGFRPATLIELLALAEIDPDLQRQFSIVSFGSVWRNGGYSHVAYLNNQGSERNLSLDWLDDDWYSYFRFFAIRK